MAECAHHVRCLTVYLVQGSGSIQRSQTVHKH